MKYVTWRGSANYVFMSYFVNDLHCFQDVITE